MSCLSTLELAPIGYFNSSNSFNLTMMFSSLYKLVPESLGSFTYDLCVSDVEIEFLSNV